jgi:hypothetical protein
MKAAIINPETGVVENVGVWSDESSPPEGRHVVIVQDDFYVGPGFHWEGGTSFTPPQKG